MASYVAFISAMCALFPISPMGLKSGDARAPEDETWKRIGAGPASPHFWEPFSMTRLIETKDGERDCWWLSNDRVKFKKAGVGRVAGLEIDQSGSEAVIEMLGPLVAPHQNHVNRKETDMLSNADCTLSEVRDKAAQRVVVTLRDPLSRILSGIEEHMGLHTHYLPQNEMLARKTFNKNFHSADEYLDALRSTEEDVPSMVPEEQKPSGIHKKAMAVTHCHHCMDFMLPVKGFYIRDTDNLKTAGMTVKFVCACKLNEEMSKVADDWDLDLQNSLQLQREQSHSNLQDSTLPISDGNRKWIEETYAADIAFYKEHCGQTCAGA